MVNNTTALPAFATAYHLHTQLRASQSQRYILMSQKGCRSQVRLHSLPAIPRKPELTQSSFETALRSIPRWDLSTSPFPSTRPRSSFPRRAPADSHPTSVTVRLSSSPDLASRHPDSRRLPRSRVAQEAEARSSCSSTWTSGFQRWVHCSTSKLISSVASARYLYF